MKAVLWGHLETVQYLVEQNANLEARDGNEMRAIDLATDTNRNRKERRVRCGPNASHYREAPHADRRRQQIRGLLDWRTPTASSPPNTWTSPRSQGQAFFKRNHDGTLEVYRPQEVLRPPPRQNGGLQTQKAWATLDRGPNYPPINAMSGYSHPDWPNVLDNNIWTEKAQLLRVSLGLPKDKQAASHVEPQLLAYLLDRHSLENVDDFTEGRELLEVMPTYSLRPIITVSKPEFCDSCREMIGLFEGRFPELVVVLHCVGESAVGRLVSM